MCGGPNSEERRRVSNVPRRNYKFGWLQGSWKLLKGKKFWLRGPDLNQRMFLYAEYSSWVFVVPEHERCGDLPPPSEEIEEKWIVLPPKGAHNLSGKNGSTRLRVDGRLRFCVDSCSCCWVISAEAIGFRLDKACSFRHRIPVTETDAIDCRPALKAGSRFVALTVVDLFYKTSDVLQPRTRTGAL